MADATGERASRFGLPSTAGSNSSSTVPRSLLTAACSPIASWTRAMIESWGRAGRWRAAYPG